VVERYLYPKRRPGPLFFVFLLWIVLTATSGGRTLHSGGAMVGFICAAGAFVSGVAFVPGAAWLKLGPQGFTVRYWFKESTYRWIDIKEFKLITHRYMGFIPLRRSVGFKFSESYPRNVLSRMAGAIVAFDRNLPDNYGMKPKELAMLLESWRRQATGIGAIGYPVSSSPIEPE